MKRLDNQYSFLTGTGEMESLTREFNWDNTQLGLPELWPQSLRTSVAMILASKFPMLIFWGDELIQFYNDAYRPSLGNNGKHPMALGQRGIDCWPEIWNFIQPLIHQVLTTGQATWNEDQLLPIFRNGKIEDVYWTFSYSPILGDTGNIDGVLVVCQETTEVVLYVKRLNEFNKKLQENNADYKKAFEKTLGISALMLADSPKYTIVAVTDDFIELQTSGIAKTDLINKGFFEVFKPNLNENSSEAEIAFRISFEHTLKYKQEHHLQELRYVMQDKDGLFIERYLTAFNKPVLDENGNVQYIIHSSIDVTDRIKAQHILEKIKRIQDSELTLRNIILQAPIAMCMLRGKNHVVELANARMFELWGKRGEEVMGKPLFEALAEAKGQGFEALLENVYTTGQSYSATNLPATLFRKGKLEDIIINFVYEAYREDDGSISGILAMAIDVTEQVLAMHKIEEIVSERTKELIKSNSDLAQFAYVASHDLQEPVRKISIFTDRLEISIGDVSESSKKYIDKIKHSANRMSKLIKNILSYAQLSKSVFVFSKVDLNDIIKDIQSDFELLILEKGATIFCSTLPVIDAIPLQISQLFGNLMSNALKFSRKDVKLVIHISTTIMNKTEMDKHQLLDQHATYYKIEFRDNGIGINDKHVDKIFNIFQRLHSKSEFEGTGIGLAITKKIAQNHHGDIYASQSEIEQGTAFFIILPERQKEILELL